MTSRFIVIVLSVAVAAHGKVILDTQNSLRPLVLPQCSPAPYLPAPSAEPQYAATLEKPPVNWPCDVKAATAPRVIGHTVHIYKTVLRPQLFRQMVIIPYLQRYIRTFQAPVLETVHIQREIPF